MEYTNNPLRILFVCTHNSCRSIMAEAIARQLGGVRLIVESVGSQPSGKINSQAIKTLAKKNIDTSQLSSKSWKDVANFNADIIVTVCSNAATEACPMETSSALQVHWGLSDPSALVGEPSVVERAFDETFNTITSCINAFLMLPLEGMSRPDIDRALTDIAQEFIVL